MVVHFTDRLTVMIYGVFQMLGHGRDFKPGTVNIRTDTGGNEFKAIFILACVTPV